MLANARLPVVCTLLLFSHSRAAACSVCYGDPSSLLSQGLTMGVVALVVVTFGVLSAFGYFFFTLWKRAQQEERP